MVRFRSLQQCAAGHHRPPGFPASLLVVPAAYPAVHLAVRPHAVSAGLRRMVRHRRRALSVGLLGRHPARAIAVPRGRARCRDLRLLWPERFLHCGAADRRPAQPRSPAGARRRIVRHSQRQAADRAAAAGDPAARAAMGDDRVGGGDRGGVGRSDRDAVRLERVARILAEGRAAAAMAHGARRRIAVCDGIVGLLRRTPRRICPQASTGRCKGWWRCRRSPR